MGTSGVVVGSGSRPGNQFPIQETRQFLLVLKRKTGYSVITPPIMKTTTFGTTSFLMRWSVPNQAWLVWREDNGEPEGAPRIFNSKEEASSEFDHRVDFFRSVKRQEGQPCLL